MTKLEDLLKPWLKEFSEFEKKLNPLNKSHEVVAFKILYEASIELYLTILLPTTTRTIKAIVTRTLIECYADVYAVFEHKDVPRQSEKYTKYALKMTKLFHKQSNNYKKARDLGDDTTRPFELARSYQACWNGMNVTARVENIDGAKNIIGYYEFFSLFAHVNPSRQVYLDHFDDPTIGSYHSYIMLIILQKLVSRSFIPEHYYNSLNSIAAEYSAEYIKTDFSPIRKYE
jgi:hypothetical protein